MESKSFHYYSLSYVFGSAFFLNNNIPETVKATEEYTDINEINVEEATNYISLSRY